MLLARAAWGGVFGGLSAMLVISHRGFWTESVQQNTIEAFAKSFSEGFGVEIDVRDLNGRIVVSHDMPYGGAITLTDFIKLAETHSSKKNIKIAVNIKSDGLAKKIKESFASLPMSSWFVFDMSIPDMLGYFELKIPVYTRLSEIETNAILIEKASGIWLDCFNSVWYDSKLVQSLIDQNKAVCIVSSELHGRDYSTHWPLLKCFAQSRLVSICTDLPDVADDFFNKT